MTYKTMPISNSFIEASPGVLTLASYDVSEAGEYVVSLQVTLNTWPGVDPGELFFRVFIKNPCSSAQLGLSPIDNIEVDGYDATPTLQAFYALVNSASLNADPDLR
jgi:hypothetical protein